jgi:hypothetical protein
MASEHAPGANSKVRSGKGTPEVRDQGDGKSVDPELIDGRWALALP